MSELLNTHFLKMLNDVITGNGNSTNQHYLLKNQKDLTIS